MISITEQLDSLRESIDKLKEAQSSARVEAAAMRVEVRALIDKIDSQYAISLERNASIHSDIRELRDQVRGVEDTSRSEILSAANAEAVIAREEAARLANHSHNWRQVIATALVSIVIALITSVVAIAAAGAI